MEIKEYRNYNEKEILNLYAAVGWTAYTDEPETLKAGFENSLMTLAAYENGKLTGILRAVGDGETIVYIQDILVMPEYQRRGIGSLLVRTALERFKNVRQIVLCTDNTPKTVAFYESLGFVKLTEICCCGFMKA